MKKIYIIIITALVSSLLTVFGYWTVQRLNAPKYDDILNEPFGIKEIKKIDYDIPEFSIMATGLLLSMINNDTLKELPIYELSAVITDGIFKYENSYKGIKVSDLVAKLNFDDYNKIVFKSNGGLQVEYSKSDLDSVFLVFEKNGYRYQVNEPIGLFNPNVYERYNITNIQKLEFTK